MIELPQSLRQAFQHLPPLNDLLWYTDQQGIPCCLIKVPHDVRFSLLSVNLSTPREPYQPLGRRPVEEWMDLVLPFSTQSAPNQQYSHRNHMFLPSSDEEWQLLVQLTQVSSVLLMGYSSDPVPHYLGKKRLNWSKGQRRAIRLWLTKRMPETLRPVPTEKRSKACASAQPAKPARWKLPTGIREALAAFPVRALITMAEEAGRSLPRIYIKVPQGTRFEEVAVAFGELNLTRYPPGWVLSLSLRLQDAAGRVLLADGLCNPISNRRLLHRLASTSTVEMIALADTPALPLLGAKRLTWSAQKQERAQALFEYVRTAKPFGSWNQACTAYLHEHMQVSVFQQPSLQPVGQQKVGDGQISSTDEGCMPDEEVSPLTDVSLPEQSNPPDTAATGAAATDHTPHTPSLVEQFILLHRLGVYEEYRHLHTLSRRIFWRLLLALAIEKTQRKFIWTAEATEVTEKHRQQLTPGTMIPWLSSQEHLWISFAEPIQTPVCDEAAALFVFSAADPELLREFARQVRLSSRALKALERSLYLPEKQRVSLGIVNRSGAVAWAMSLKIEAPGQSHDTETVWVASAWYSCPSQQCHLHSGKVATLCEACLSTRTFVWTWLVAAWHSLRGSYRVGSEKDVLESIGEERIERLTRPMPEPGRSEER